MSSNNSRALTSHLLEGTVGDVKVVVDTDGKGLPSDINIDVDCLGETNACEYEVPGGDENFQVTERDLDGIVEITELRTCHDEEEEEVELEEGDEEGDEVKEGDEDEEEEGDEIEEEEEEVRINVELIDTPITITDASLMEIEPIHPDESIAVELTLPIAAHVAVAPTLNDTKNDTDDIDINDLGLVKNSSVIVTNNETTSNHTPDDTNITVVPVITTAMSTQNENENENENESESENENENGNGNKNGNGNGNENENKNENENEANNNNNNNNERFYALRKGKSTGNCIYLQYSHMAAQIQHFPDAQHAIFNDWKDAVAFIQNYHQLGSSTTNSSPSQLPNSSVPSSTQTNKRKSTDTDDAIANHPRKEAKHDTTITLNEKTAPLQNYPIVIPSQPEWESQVYVSVYNTDSWDVMYQSLKSFYAEAGNTDVPPGSRLGAWVVRQRKEYQSFIAGKESDMTQERVDKLQAVNFFFTSVKKALKFEQRVDEFIKFKEENDAFDPPSNTLLYKWIYSMRRKYRDIKDDKPVAGLDQLKIQRLDEIGFSWSNVKENRKQQKQQYVVQDQDTKPKAKKLPARISKKELRWTELFEQLKTYKEETGNFTVTRHGSTLGRWVSSQRLAYRKFKNGEIYSPIFNEDKIQKLIDIGFDFECKRGRKSGVEDASVWDEMYEEMQKFKEENGHCIPPTQPSTPLRRWVEKQRSEYKKIRAGEDSHLTLMRIQRLNDIGFSFEAKCKPKTWEERYDELVEFKAKFGHCKVPRLYNGLGKWVADQRQKYSKLTQDKKTNMTQEKAQKLTDLGMIWVVFKLPPKEERAVRKPWAERFQELLAFQNEHGHTVVPQHFPVLGHWVHTQRVHYKLMKQGRKSLMTPEQAFQLADIGFTFEVMPRKKSTIRQSLGNPYPHLPLIASAGETPEATEVARTFPRHQLTGANLDQMKDVSTPYHNTDESILYDNKDDVVPYPSRDDGTQYHNKDHGTAYGIDHTFDEYGI